MHKAGVLMGAHAMLICPGASVCMIVAPFTSSYADNISQASTSVRFRMKQYIEKKSGVKVAMNMGSGRCDDKFHNVTTIISDAVTRDECVCMCVCVCVFGYRKRPDAKEFGRGHGISLASCILPTHSNTIKSIYFARTMLHYEKKHTFFLPTIHVLLLAVLFVTEQQST